jgi:hypothetical protein
MVVLEAFFCPVVDETKLCGLEVTTSWSRLLSWSLSAYASGILFCSTATSSGLFFASNFASPFAKDSLPDPVFS